jgi:hypothetical protein
MRPIDKVLVLFGVIPLPQPTRPRQNLALVDDPFTAAGAFGADEKRERTSVELDSLDPLDPKRLAKLVEDLRRDPILEPPILDLNRRTPDEPRERERIFRRPKDERAKRRKKRAERAKARR